MNSAYPGGYNCDPANYGPGTVAKPPHAPAQVGGGSTLVRFTYDANGTMTTGLGGKVMTYDGENRPLSVLNGSALILTCAGSVPVSCSCQAALCWKATGDFQPRAECFRHGLQKPLLYSRRATST